MDIFTIGFWVVTVALSALALKRDPKKTFAAMKRSRKMMGAMLGEIVAILFLLGLVLTFLPPPLIQSVLGSARPLLATVVSAVVGSITLIPAFVAFPLVGSLVDAGASMIPGAAFLTTLTMVGVVTFPLEKKEFGLRFALVRNALSFIFAIGIALAMGVIL